MTERCNHILIIALLLVAGTAPLRAFSPLDASLHPLDYPELDGHTVRIGLVELSRTETADSPGFHFMPNLTHRALAEANLTGVHCYRNNFSSTNYSPHATTITGILVGNDPQAYISDTEKPAYRGIIPEAALTIYETNWFIYKRILPHSVAVTEDILTISWGTDANDAMSQWWQRGMDALVIRDQCLVVAGCGNGRDQFHSITKPSAGYNILSVGAAAGLGYYPENLTSVAPPWINHSNYGPTEDGRAKPDCIARGLHVSPDASSRDQYILPQDGQSYSSFAAPVVAGLAGLLIDAARQNDMSEADDPRLIKALILNGADKLTGWHKGMVTLEDDPFVPLDYAQGAGLINFSNSLEQLLSGRFTPHSPENTGWDIFDLPQNSQKFFPLPQPLDPNDQLKATLTWYRPYQQNKSFTADPLSPIYLELWQLGEEGNPQLLLDHSISDIDNLQHIYYQSDHEAAVALLVRTGDNRTPDFLQVKVALAFTTLDHNDPGDLLMGDLNADGIIDVKDAHLLINQIDLFPQHDPTVQTGDLNQDGTIDASDFRELLQHWNQQSHWY